MVVCSQVLCGLGTPSTPTGNGPVRTSKLDGATGSTGDKTRDKCVELVYDALASDSTARMWSSFSSPVGANCRSSHRYDSEACLGSGACSIQELRKQRQCRLQEQVALVVRQPQGQKQPHVARGHCFGRYLWREVRKHDERGMHFLFWVELGLNVLQEMASEEQKAALKKIKEQNLFKSLAAQEAEAETDAFQCSKCKQRKCRYRQAQTRSADEPMTVSPGPLFCRIITNSPFTDIRNVCSPMFRSFVC